MGLALVIPAHNEEGVIAHTIKSIEGELKSLDYEIIVINDHSSDNTAAIVEGLRKTYSNLRLVNNDNDRGFASALKKGFSVSSADFIIPVMADLCDDPKTIKEMYDRAAQGFDIVCGSRYMGGGGKIGGPALQSFFSRFVGRSLRCLIKIPTCDVSNSFKCYRRSMLKNMPIQSRSFEISMEITLDAYFLGAAITEVPSTWRGRNIGKSKFYLFKVAPRYIRLYLLAVIKKIWQTLF